MAKAGQKRVAVIGAGASGLPAIKWCIQYGFNVLCYEKQNDIAGLWRYRQTDCDGEGCVMKSTVINTSKEMTAYSDFPPPADYANFMHNSQMLAYLRSYAEHFDLTKHIRFGTTVNNVFRDKDGKWIVQSEQNSNNVEESFDGVMLCTGHHVDPYVAHFTDEHLFAGKMPHSHSYKDHRGYEDLNVLVVGVGNSGGDIAVELSRIAKQVYLVARRGTWVINRIFDYGQPVDIVAGKRIVNAVKSRMPVPLLNLSVVAHYTLYLICIMSYKLNSRFDHLAYGLKPAHGPLSAHPTVNDELPNRIACGTIRIKPAIHKFTGPKAVKFVDGSELDDIDTVIVSTGYSFSFPLLEKGELVPVAENRVDLYKNMYLPTIEKPETMAILGLIQPIGSVMPISEMQARLFCHMLNLGERQRARDMPGKRAMMEDIEEKHEAMKRQYVTSRRHTIQVEYGDYMDELAELMGCKPNAVEMLKCGQVRLAFDVLCRPQASYQYRLVGPHQWPGAVDAIRAIDQRVLKATQSSVPVINKSDRSCANCTIAAALFVALIIFYFYFW